MFADLHQIPLRDQSVYDELSTDGVTPRPHWTAFVNDLQQIPSEEFAKRCARAERRIRENGVTYNMYSDPEGAERPWRTDLIPLLLGAGEWRTIEAGIVQYAELLEIILKDVYGSQSLLSKGILPSELVFANSGFLRPLARNATGPDTYLHLVGIDLARSPDGQWWVVAHRTQSPSGAGYALENRTIVEDALPEFFLSSNVQRLAPFFRAQRQALMNLAGRDDARIVLLTPGPLNETYFEHSYLARYLGFTLVESSDLTVRDRCVYIKTVSGLNQVDVIVRRVDDTFCDPLELRADSLLGVSGLVDSALAGNVKIANALGSGVIETPAILPFLPALCRELLGETLRLPSVATWWCGQQRALDWVVDHLEQIVVKPAFPRLTDGEPVFGADLSAAEKTSLLRRLRVRPFHYVGQERVLLSKTPVWDRGNIYSRSLMLRTYVINTGSGWQALPGGLVRIAADDGNVVSMQRGGHSKDAWVLGDSAASPSEIVASPANRPPELRRAVADLPSRVADNLFWLGRYVERSENIARLLRTSLSRVRRADRGELHCLVRLHRCFDTKEATFSAAVSPSAEELESELLSLMTDSKRRDSLAGNIEEVLRIGGNVRERLSADMTRLIGQLREAIRVEQYMLFSEHTALLTGCLELLSAFSGMERENLTRGPGWLFLSLGRRVERAIYTTRFSREIATPLETDQWPVLEYLLEVADSSITYRTRYLSTPEPHSVLDLLMLDDSNPRSLEFQLSHLADLFEKLPRHMDDDARAIHNALYLLKNTDLQHIEYAASGNPAPPATEQARRRLLRLLNELERLLRSWADNLASTYFSHVNTLPITIGE